MILYSTLKHLKSSSQTRANYRKIVNDTRENPSGHPGENTMTLIVSSLFSLLNYQADWKEGNWVRRGVSTLFASPPLQKRAKKTVRGSKTHTQRSSLLAKRGKLVASFSYTRSSCQKEENRLFYLLVVERTSSDSIKG